MIINITFNVNTNSSNRSAHSFFHSLKLAFIYNIIFNPHKNNIKTRICPGGVTVSTKVCGTLSLSSTLSPGTKMNNENKLVPWITFRF